MPQNQLEHHKQLTLTTSKPPGKPKLTAEQQSLRGRGNEEENDDIKLDKQSKRALKKKMARQRKKERQR